MPILSPTLALTFLAPLTGVLIAALATPVLLLFYFLKLRRRPVRISSTLLWEQAVQDLQVNAPFRWLRASLLLLLQLLILGLLALAAARPALDLPGLGADRVILLIDRSASMNARSPDPDAPTRLDAAADRARELVDRLASADTEVMLVAFADRPVTLLNFSRDRGALRDALASIEPTDQPGDLTAALRVAAAFAAAAPTEDAPAPEPPLVVLVSDGSFDRTRAAGPSAVPALGAAEIRYIPPAPPAADEPAPTPDNLAVLALSARRDYDDPALLRVFARLGSTRAEPTTAAIELALDGDVLEARTLTIPPAETPGAGPRLGEAPVTFDAAVAAGGVLTLTIRRADDLTADNAAGLLLTPPDPPAILVVRPAPPTRAPELFLTDALASLDPAELRERTAEQYASDPAAAFAGIDLAVFDRVRPDELPPVPTISFDATVPIPGLRLREPVDGGRRIAFWRRTHPVMRYAGLNDVALADPRPIALPVAEETDDAAIDETAPADGPPRVALAEPLASISEGPVIALIEDAGVRRLVLGFSLLDTFWWRDLSFPVFIANAVDHLTLRAGSAAGRAVATDEPVTLQAAPGATEILVTAPDGSTTRHPAGPGGRTPVGVLPRVGLYTLDGAPPELPALPVNLLDATESALAIERSVDIAGEPRDATTARAVAPREVWRWLVAAAMALLVLEWFVFARRMRV